MATPRKYSDEQIADMADRIPQLMLSLGGNWTKVAVVLGLGGDDPAAVAEWYKSELAKDSKRAAERRKVFDGFGAARARRSLDSLKQYSEIKKAEEEGQALILDEIEQTANDASMGRTRGVNTNAATRRLAAGRSERWNPKQEHVIDAGGMHAEELKEIQKQRDKGDSGGSVSSVLTIVQGDVDSA